MYLIDIFLFIKVFLTHLFAFSYLSLDPQRLVVLHFSIVGLDILGCLDACINAELRSKLIDWVYLLQTPQKGWSGSPLLQAYDSTPSHLAPTYSAICILLTLRDDLSRVNKQGIVNLINNCSFHITNNNNNKIDELSHNHNLLTHTSSLSSSPSPSPSSCSCSELGVYYASDIHDEYDVRFTFCAIVLCKLLNLWDNVELNYTAIFHFIANCQVYDGSFTLTNGFREGHGGATHTAVTSYYMLLEHFVTLPKLEQQRWVVTPFDVKKLTKWIVSLQGDGFRGRTCKPRDCCYTYWCGSLFSILRENDNIDPLFVNPRPNSFFIQYCENTSRGGFGKNEDAQSEILHTFYAIAGTSLMKTYDDTQQELKEKNENVNEETKPSKWDSIQTLDSVIGITQRASGFTTPYQSFYKLFSEIGIFL